MARRKAFRIASSTVHKPFGASAVLIARVNASSRRVGHESGRTLGLASQRREPEVSSMVPGRRQETLEAGCSLVKALPVDETRKVSTCGRDNADHIEAPVGESRQERCVNETLRQSWQRLTTLPLRQAEPPRSERTWNCGAHIEAMMPRRPFANGVVEAGDSKS